MWGWVGRILQALLGIGVSVGQQIKAAWIQARAIVLAVGLLVAKYWGARLAWRIAIAAVYIALMTTATSAILNFAVPEMSDVLSLFGASDLTRNHEGIFHIFWDEGLNLKAFFAMLRRAVAALVVAWSARKLWSLFLVRRIINPPL